jgi:hypothetical protein
MYRQLMKALALLAFAALTSASHAAEAESPGRAGRISLVQGQVSLGGDVGSAAEGALLNWPVTSNNQISTARGARAEFRVGSTAVRLDGDSAMDIVVLDDDVLQLRLHYGSASVKVRNAELVRGFELSTPQGRVRLQDVATFRVDADRRPDTTLVNVFDGAVLVEGGGASLTVRAGRRAELQNDELHTGLAVRDGFDDWAALRDQRDDRVNSTRYVSQETTGYEELDQYGSWASNNEYGAIWTPRTVGVNWAPYRDGRWAWVAPWGWTWVDNAPWGYAPFHYGRWVMVGHRWCWAPGRMASRPVWAPALVGWVGGGNWQLSFNIGGSHRRGPAMGWYPLSPRDAFVPGYRARAEHVRQINAYVRNDHDDRRDDRRGDRRDDRRDDRRGGHQRDGMTVVPHGQFGNRGSFAVPTAPKALVQPTELRSAPTSTAPVVQGPPLPPPMLRAPGTRPEFRPESGNGNRHEGRPETRRDRDDAPAAAPRTPARPLSEQAAPVQQPVTPTLQVSPAQPAVVPTPAATVRPPRDHRPDQRNDQREDRRQEPRTEHRQPAQVQPQPQPAAATPQAAAPAVVMPPPLLRRDPERAQPAPRVVTPAVEAPRAIPEKQEPRAPAARPEKQEQRQEQRQEKQEKRDKTDGSQDRNERAGRNSER